MTKNRTQTSTIDQIIVRAHSLKPAARVEFLRKHSVGEIVAIYTRVVGKSKPKTPRPVMEKRILAALAEPAPATSRHEAPVAESAEAPVSKPLDRALEENPVAEANAASWDAALPQPGYVPPAGTGDEPAAHDGTHDEAPADDAAPTPADDAGGAPAAEPSSNEASPAGDAARVAGDRDPRLPAVGTTIIKKDRHGNERARCTIVEDGVEYAGATYKSISAAAMAAAKDLGLASKTQDGYAFWGLKKGAPRAAKKDAVETLQKAWERYHERAAAAAKVATDESRAKIYDAIKQHLVALNTLAATVA